MSLDSLLDRAVTIVTAGTTTDRQRNTVVDWSTVTRATTVGWLAQTDASEPQTSSERLGGTTASRDAQVSRYKLFLPAGTVITGRDRVEIDGVTYQVDGPPVRARRPGEEHHVECKVFAVEG